MIEIKNALESYLSSIADEHHDTLFYSDFNKIFTNISNLKTEILNENFEIFKNPELLSDDNKIYYIHLLNNSGNKLLKSIQDIHEILSNIQYLLAVTEKTKKNYLNSLINSLTLPTNTK